MSSKETGGPAFPGGVNAIYTNIEKGEPTQSGMTMRDYFAAKVMHQFLAGSILPSTFDATEQFLELARRSYEMADAMLKERAK